MNFMDTVRVAGLVACFGTERLDKQQLVGLTDMSKDNYSHVYRFVVFLLLA